MKFPSALRSRAAAVAAGAVVLTVAAGGTALASGKLTSHDIENGTIRAVDMAPGSVNSGVIHDNSVQSADIKNGTVGDDDLSQGVRDKMNRPSYNGADWSVIDRNVIGNGDAYLRSGPSAAGGVAPPSGIGSLGLRTGAAGDKAAFGDQVDFAGKALSSINTVSYYVFTTGENNSAAANNLPSVAFEVDPNTPTRTFSTLLYVPTQRGRRCVDEARRQHRQAVVLHGRVRYRLRLQRHDVLHPGPGQGGGARRNALHGPDHQGPRLGVQRRGRRPADQRHGLRLRAERRRPAVTTR